MLLSDFTNSEPVWVSGRTYKVGDIVRSPGDWYFKYVRTTNGAGTTDPLSDSANWRPDGARPIKSIQRGHASISSGSSSTTVTISAVNMAKTELRYLGAGGANASGYPMNTFIYLTNSTTIQVALSDGLVYGHGLSWELTEYY